MLQGLWRWQRSRRFAEGRDNVSIKKVLIGILILALAGAVVAANLWFRRTPKPTVTMETIKRRDLEAVVSASGKIQPKRSVNISADTMGRVVTLAVDEGQRVTRGQFLMEIDPKSLRTRVDSGEAAFKAAQSTLDSLRQAVETARAQLNLAQQNLQRQRDLWAKQLTTREALERAENEVQVRQSDLSEREKQARTQELRIAQERATLDSARYDLSKVRIESPIDGIVTRRNIQEGETVVVGTMNNAGTVLLTIADMSVVQGEVEVDETSVPMVVVGQRARVTIDAVPDRSFRAHVTEIGNSPIQAASQQSSSARQATTFKVVVTLDEEIPDIRPGFTCTADITTATRKAVVAVPIQAVAVRELIYDAAGTIVPEPTAKARPRTPVPAAATAELPPGQVRKETEGVFVLREGDRADFVPIKIGIAGDTYFEVLLGLRDGDRVITGPYSSVREIRSGDLVAIETPRS
jgi:HlyD family secretion protein